MLKASDNSITNNLRTFVSHEVTRASQDHKRSISTHSLTNQKLTKSEDDYLARVKDGVQLRRDHTQTNGTKLFEAINSEDSDQQQSVENQDDRKSPKTKLIQNNTEKTREVTVSVKNKQISSSLKESLSTKLKLKVLNSKVNQIYGTDDLALWTNPAGDIQTEVVTQNQVHLQEQLPKKLKINQDQLKRNSKSTTNNPVVRSNGSALDYASARNQYSLKSHRKVSEYQNIKTNNPLKNNSVSSVGTLLRKSQVDVRFKMFPLPKQKEFILPSSSQKNPNRISRNAVIQNNKLENAVPPARINPEVEAIKSFKISQNPLFLNETNNLNQPNSQIFDLQCEISNQFLNPTTLINQHLQQINVKKQQFAVDLADLQSEIQTHRVSKQRVQLLRLQRKKQQELEKLHKDEKAIYQVHANISNWQVQKKEIQERARAIAKEREKQIERNRLEAQRDEQISGWIKQQRERITKKLLNHEIKFVRKQNKINEVIERRKRFYEVKVSTPKFVSLEKKIKEQEQIEEKNKEAFLQQRKAQKIVDFKEIRTFEKQYSEKIKARSVSQKNIQVVHPVQFNLSHQKDPVLVAFLAQKKKKLTAFRQKLELIRPRVDSAKKTQRQMCVDKMLNPLKYSILKQRGISDIDIFNNYRDFKVNQNPRSDGDNFLEQLKNKHKSLGSFHKQELKDEPTPQPPRKYINYLPLLNIKPRKLDKIQIILGKKITSEQKASILFAQSEALEIQAEDKLDKLQQLKEGADYSQQVNVQSEVDDLFVKALKAKLACATLAV